MKGKIYGIEISKITSLTHHHYSLSAHFFQSYHPGLLEYIIFVFFSRVLKPDMLQADKGRSKGEIMEMCRKFERTSFEP